MTISKAVCFIPAKAASTRLKKKNLLKLKGKELLYYPIRNGLDSGLFNKEDVIVSTESHEIKDIAEKYGANVPYLREEKLARDPFGTLEVALDFLDKFPKYKKYDSLCLLFPTAPFLIHSDIVNAYKIFKAEQFNALASVTETNHNALRSVFLRNNKIVPLFGNYISKKSQELEKTFRFNGAFTIVNMKAFLSEKSWFLKPWGGYEIPWNRGVDIDNEEGYLFAKFLIDYEINSDFER